MATVVTAGAVTAIIATIAASSQTKKVQNKQTEVPHKGLTTLQYNRLLANLVPNPISVQGSALANFTVKEAINAQNINQTVLVIAQIVAQDVNEKNAVVQAQASFFHVQILTNPLSTIRVSNLAAVNEENLQIKITVGEAPNAVEVNQGEPLNVTGFKTASTQKQENGHDAKKIDNKLHNGSIPGVTGNPDETPHQAESNPDTPNKIANKIAKATGVPASKIHVTPEAPTPQQSANGEAPFKVTVGTGPNAVPVNGGKPVIVPGYKKNP